MRLPNSTIPPSSEVLPINMGDWYYNLSDGLAYVWVPLPENPYEPHHEERNSIVYQWGPSIDLTKIVALKEIKDELYDISTNLMRMRCN
jgi:hypothetical protein